MGMQELKGELNSLNLFDDFTGVLKSLASVKFPKAKNRLQGFRLFGDAVQDNLLLAFNSISPEDVTAKNFKDELDAFSGVDTHLEIEEGLKTHGLEQFFKPSDGRNTLVIVISANMGFCGKYNRDVNNLTEALLEGISGKSKVKLVTIGKKAGDYFNLKGQVAAENMLVFPEKNEEEKVQLSNFILKNIILGPFLKKEISEVKIVYDNFTEFPRVVTKPMIVPLLPIPRLDIKKKDSRRMVFEPSPLICLSYLIREYLFSLMMKFFIEAETAENYMRMIAMNQASESIKESKEKKEAEIRKFRQTQITKELVEIISGAEALKNRDN